MKLSVQILIGLALGLVVGVILNEFQSPWTQTYLVDGVLHIIGQMFFSALQLLVVPVVFFSLSCGVASIGSSLRTVGRIATKTLSLYLLTTVLAIGIAMLAAIFIGPGEGFDLQTSAQFDAATAPSLREVIIGFIPTNPVRAMAEANMIQIIVLAFLVGASMALAGEAGQRTRSLFEDLNEVMMRLVSLVIATAPVGVFCLLAKVFAEQGFHAIFPLASYFFLIIAVLVLHVVFSYGMLLQMNGLYPLRFFRKMKEVMIFAFSTSSSNATLPVTLRVVEKELGVKNSIASFTLPLGATINMDGTAIMQGVATVFISQAYGIDIGLTGYLTVVAMAALASVGTAGVPGVGMITLAMVLQQVGLPVEGIGLILGVDRLLDMLRTVANVTGDAAVTCVVAKSEGAVETELFQELTKA